DDVELQVRVQLKTSSGKTRDQNRGRRELFPDGLFCLTRLVLKAFTTEDAEDTENFSHDDAVRRRQRGLRSGWMARIRRAASFRPPHYWRRRLTNGVRLKPDTTYYRK